jgi:hypothetical protein
MYHSSCKCNMDIMVGMLLKYSWIKFMDTLLFTVCVTCIQTSSLISKLSVQKDQDPEVFDLSLEHWRVFKRMDKLYFMQFTSISWYIQMTTNTVHGMNNIKFTYRFICRTMPCWNAWNFSPSIFGWQFWMTVACYTLSVKPKTWWSFVRYENIERGKRL